MKFVAMDRALTLLVPSASPIWGLERGELPENAAYWQRVNAVTAESYGMHLVYANRVGFEDGVGFWGGSEILGPSGEVLARAKYYEPDMIAAEVNLASVRRKRIAAPMLRDENVDLTINELMRIRGRDAVTPAALKAVPTQHAAPVLEAVAARRTPPRRARVKPTKTVKARKAARRR